MGDPEIPERWDPGKGKKTQQPFPSRFRSLYIRFFFLYYAFLLYPYAFARKNRLRRDLVFDLEPLEIFFSSSVRSLFFHDCFVRFLLFSGFLCVFEGRVPLDERKKELAFELLESKFSYKRSFLFFFFPQNRRSDYLTFVLDHWPFYRFLTIFCINLTKKIMILELKKNK